MFRATLILLGLVLSTAAFADSHIRTVTRDESGPIKQSDTYAKNGDLMIQDRGYSISASASQGAGRGRVKVGATPGELEDTTIFHLEAQEILALENGNPKCHWVSKNTKMPEGMVPGSGQMAELKKQHKAGMAQLNKALAEARSKMSAKDREMVDQYTGGLLSGEMPGIKPRDSLTLRKTGNTKTIEKFDTVSYEAVTPSDDVRYVLWLTDINKVDGATEVKNALLGMIEFYEQFLKGMGGESLMDSSVFEFLKSDELKGLYPIRMEDKRSGTWSDVVYASNASVSEDFYPDCEKVDMMSAFSGR